MRAATFVRRVLGPLEGVIHSARLACVSRVVATICAARVMRLTTLGRALGGRAADKHNIKAVNDLLANKHLLKEVGLFQSLFAASVPKKGRPILLVDWTDVGPLWTALVVTLVVEGRGLVLCWEVHPRAQNASPQVQSSILKRLKALLPPNARPILITDAGFCGPWMKAVRAHGWDFVTRVRRRVLVRTGTSGWVTVRSNWKRITSNPVSMGWVELARKGTNQVELVGIWKKKRSPKKPLPRVGRRKQRHIRDAREPWVLATSLVPSAGWSAGAVVSLYALRMRIEETFRDQKCRRFGLGLGDVETKLEQRIAIYVLLAALAHYVSMLLGRVAEAAQLHRAFQANTFFKRRVLSWARLGSAILKRALEHSYKPLARLRPSNLQPVITCP